MPSGSRRYHPQAVRRDPLNTLAGTLADPGDQASASGSSPALRTGRYPSILVGQDQLQLPPGADAELGEHLAQVPFDRVGTAEELGEIVAVSLSFTLRCPQDGRARKPPSPGSCRLPPWRSGARSHGSARRQFAQAAASMFPS